jgi:hypothetical protein
MTDDIVIDVNNISVNKKIENAEIDKRKLRRKREQAVERSKLSTGISVNRRCQTVWRDRQRKLMRRSEQQKRIV